MHIKIKYWKSLNHSVKNADSEMEKEAECDCPNQSKSPPLLEQMPFSDREGEGGQASAVAAGQIRSLCF